jgi:hypothetical protein
MKDFETVTLRCLDGAEAVVFAKYYYNNLKPDYEIAVEDCYIGGEYKGFFGRLKRAWRAFIDKPVTYTGIYTDDKEKIRKFLTDSLALLDNVEETP